MSRRLALAVAVPSVAVSLVLAGTPAFAAGTTAAAGSKRFCGESTALVKDLLTFGKLPKTTSAVATALTRVDREFKQLALDAPTRADRTTITTMRAEFAKLKTIVLTDPDGLKAVDRTFVAGFSRTAVKQGQVLGGEIKAACR